MNERIINMANTKKVKIEDNENINEEVIKQTQTNNEQSKIEEVKETKIESIIKTTRRKAITIDRNEMIPCRSLVYGRLTYISTRNGLMTVWNDFGTLEYLEYGEILTMRASQPKFLNKPWIIIEDEEVVESIGGLKEMYDKLSDIGDINTFFNKNPKDFEDTFVKLPSGAKSLIATKGREMIENETLYDTRIINIIDKYLETGLKDLIK
jgi:hypothetical protein